MPAQREHLVNGVTEILLSLLFLLRGFILSEWLPLELEPRPPWVQPHDPLTSLAETAEIPGKGSHWLSAVMCLVMCWDQPSREERKG